VGCVVFDLQPHLVINGEQMRLLHTSDWHIGIKLGNFDYLPSQKEFANWLLAIVKTEAIDVVLVAGDIFDKSTPSEDSINLVDEIFVNLLGIGVSVVVISGNHDSAERLNFCSRAMENAGLYIRTEQRNLSDIGVPIHFEKNGESVSIIPIPFLDPQRVIEIGEAERSHGGLIKEILRVRVKEVEDPSKTVVMSHAFVAGGSESDSERKISVGGAARVATDVYQGFGYVALGHLHRPQPVGGPNMYYSGTPLQYSFSEEHSKTVRIIEIGEDVKTREVGIPVGPTVVTLTDSLDNLISDVKYKSAENHLVRVKLTDSSRRLNAQDRLSSRFANLIFVSYVNDLSGSNFAGSTNELRRLSPEQIVDQYIDAVHPGTVTPELMTFIKQSVQFAILGGN
jgi:DNA repair protein SbcD/Mre11